MLAKHPAQYLPQSMGSMVHGGYYNLSVNYTLRFTSGLWHNGKRTRESGYEDPDYLMCSAAHSTLGLRRKAGTSTTQLVVWSFLACQGSLGIPLSVPH